MGTADIPEFRRSRRSGVAKLNLKKHHPGGRLVSRRIPAAHFHRIHVPPAPESAILYENNGEAGFRECSGELLLESPVVRLGEREGDRHSRGSSTGRTAHERRRFRAEGIRVDAAASAAREAHHAGAARRTSHEQRRAGFAIAV